MGKVANSASLLSGEPEQEVSERVPGRGKTGKSAPVRAVEGELPSHSLGSDRIQSNPPDFAADFEIVPAGVERKMVNELERIVLEAQGASTFVITRAGKTRDCELRSATQARTAGKRESSDSQLCDDVVAGNCCLRRSEFRITQVAKAKFVERGRPDDVAVAKRECLIANEAEFSVARKSSWVELAGIIKAVAAKDGVLGSHQLVDPAIELIKIIGSRPSVEIVLARIAVGAKAAGRVGQGKKTGQRQGSGCDRIEAVAENDVAWEWIADHT